MGVGRFKRSRLASTPGRPIGRSVIRRRSASAPVTTTWSSSEPTRCGGPTDSSARRRRPGRTTERLPGELRRALLALFIASHHRRRIPWGRRLLQRVHVRDRRWLPADHGQRRGVVVGFRSRDGVPARAVTAIAFSKRIPMWRTSRCPASTSGSRAARARVQEHERAVRISHWTNVTPPDTNLPFNTILVDPATAEHRLRWRRQRRVGERRRGRDVDVTWGPTPACPTWRCSTCSDRSDRRYSRSPSDAGRLC